MKSYPGVYNGTIDKIVSFPPKFDYNCREMQYGDIGEANKRINELEQKTSNSMQDSKEKKNLNTIKNKWQPLRSENNVRDRFLHFLSGRIGLNLQGYNPGEYLKMLKIWRKINEKKWEHAVQIYFQLKSIFFVL